MDEDLKTYFKVLTALIVQADRRAQARHVEQMMVTLIRTGMNIDDSVKHAEKSAESVDSILPLYGLISDK